MTKFMFADRYAEAALAPTPQIISSREAPAARIVDNITAEQIFALVSVYYGDSNSTLGWFRDEFVKDDASFSLVNNERETRVLAAAILGWLVAEGDTTAILAIATGNVSGLRRPALSEWLVRDALAALARISVEERKPKQIEPKITSTASPRA